MAESGVLHHFPDVVSYAATQDSLLERSNRNMGTFSLLIVAKHTGYPLKRSLVQFETPESRDGTSVSAKVQLTHLSSLPPCRPSVLTLAQVLISAGPWHRCSACARAVVADPSSLLVMDSSETPWTT